jgi:prepilin-type N-terminal cleavage/methylation domain-containing protein
MNKSFTLIELVVVMTIIGILVSFAIPQYTTITEKGRAAEGVGILGAIRAAQLRLYAETGGYTPGECELTTTATNCGLDITVGPLKYFERPSTGIVPAFVGYIQRSPNATFGQYWLRIGADGTITCKCGTAGACVKLGFIDSGC